MKKIYLILFVIIMSLVLSSCDINEFKSYFKDLFDMPDKDHDDDDKDKHHHDNDDDDKKDEYHNKKANKTSQLGLEKVFSSQDEVLVIQKTEKLFAFV